MLVCPLIFYSLFLSLIRPCCYRVTVFSARLKKFKILYFIYIYAHKTCCKLLVLQDYQIMQFLFNFILHPVPQTTYRRKKNHFYRKCLLKFGSCMSMASLGVTQRSPCTGSVCAAGAALKPLQMPPAW